MRSLTVHFVAVLLASSLLAESALEAQEPTRVLVRVVAHDAKIIGSGVGGASVTILDARTGAVLAEGVQAGGTGSTDKIMGSRARGAPVYQTEGAAGFLATLDLREPTQVEIIGEGPLGTPHAIQRASKTTWLFPGHDVVGEGIILELLGFTVALLSPEDGSALRAGQSFDVRSSVTMLCGCATQPGGTWDSMDYRIVARIVQGGEVTDETEMAFAGVTSTYVGELVAPAAGDATVEVLVMDPAKGNFGWVSKNVTVTGRPSG